MEDHERLLHGEGFRPTFLYQYLATITGALIVLCSGMHSAWPSPTLPQLLNETSDLPQITSSEGSWLVVMPCLGAPFGAILTALLVDQIGRKSCILLCSPIYLTAWLLIAFSPWLSLLMFSRVLVGIADGILFTVFPAYVAEISDRSVRGFLGSSITVAFTLGTLIINCLGLYFDINITALVGAVVPILHFMTFFWMPESPLFYIINEKFEEADASLSKLTGVQGSHLDFTHQRSQSSEDQKSKFWNLFRRKSNVKALLISIGLRIVQQFSGNFVILFYCLLIFNEAGGAISASTATIIYFCIQLITSGLSTLLVDKTGRRPLLIVSLIGTGVTLAAQGVYFYIKNETDINLYLIGYVPLTALVLYNIFFNIGLSCLPTLILSELFATNVKSIALCVCDIVFALAVLLAAKFFQICKDEFGMHVPFVAFALFCAFGLIFVVICLPETKGKTLHQIQEALKS